tara:strand:+ start:6207 stop:6707 length:501 start_codon:yes stop_codon:yes gene_type:complete
MEVHLIWAQDFEGGIGLKGQLPWHISEDLKNFKKITFGHTVLMGRKTWDSLPFKPLPKRRNIILSRSKLIKCEAEIFNDINSCIETLKNQSIEKLFVIGGSSIYNAFFDYADFLHISFIYEKIDNIDTHFPKDLNEIKEKFKIDKKIKLSDKADYTFWEKKIKIGV